ncbi:CBS domain-containing protein [Propioniciclava tarda]|uniref:CBS domain-containing protein n=1 Tax=Propioniciclava tarda TaxID=433330 RepID=A0A4Q9KKR8_PROTD|nr:CBS domain-containing protein [Propioniciclava tarda]TBT94470.1 CBS domain-containing protein [Propioniciclava tarda]SMO70019.1 CBS domain-containing protein [Propioniciclava tarda]HOA88859.1 CBS domain-containing protein [Propioniciclava tarda]
MKIEDVIRSKGDTNVVTIAPTATVSELVQTLTGKRIGALVVSADGEHIDGIVSERDIVRGLADLGRNVMDATVADLMTADVYTAEPTGTVEDAAHSMTVHRIRHMPVLVDGHMVGLVSIGDVVKHRIDQLTDERDHLIGYLQS